MTGRQSEQKRGRGRPKGSGIDDAALLGNVRALLAADPVASPTTAIKRAGVSDPSAVRRLRDKLRAAPLAIPPGPSLASAPLPALRSKQQPIPLIETSPPVATARSGGP